MSVPTDDGEELWVDLPHGPVVPVELFEETQRNVEFIENNPKNLRNKLRVYVLKDLLRFEDGSKFRGKSGTGRLGDRYYYYRNETHQISIDAKEIEQSVMKSLRVYENDKAMVEYAGEIKSNVTTKLDLINRQIASVNAQLKKLDEDERRLPASFDAMRDGSDRLMAWLERQLKATEAQRQDLQNSLRCLEKERDQLALVSVDSRSLRNSLKAVFTRFEAAAPHLQRSILRQVFEKIIVFRDNHLRIDWAPALRDTGGPEVAMRSEWGGKRPSGQRKRPPLQVPLIADFVVVPSYKDSTVLRQKYVDECLSIADIAAQFSSSESTIHKYLRLAGIKVRPADLKNKSRLAYGEAWKDGRVTRHEKESANIEKMRELRAKGFSYGKIADVLNSMGVKTKHRKGCWHARYVQKLLERLPRERKI